MGRATRGVRGMKLAAKQQVLSLLIADNDQQTVLVATENGYGKRTVLADFRHSGRGTQGVKAIAISERNGLVVAAKLVNEEDEIMLITTGGVLIRTRVKEIRELGRATQGVTLINLGAVSYTHLDVYKRQPVKSPWLTLIPDPASPHRL